MTTDSSRYTRIVIATSAGSIATFANIYGVQALLPSLSTEFGVSSAVASLAVSVTTFVLAFALLAASPLSERFGRTGPMTISLFATALLTLISAVAPNFTILVVARGLAGLALAGVPAIAVAYLGEEVPREKLGSAVGIFVATSSLGGLSGRILTAVATDLVSWRAGLITLGMLSLVLAIVFWRLIPPSLGFRPSTQPTVSAFMQHLRNWSLLRLFGAGFILQGGFLAFFNYLAFRLVAPPFQLNQSAIGAIFLVYLVGATSSAMLGRVADKRGLAIALIISTIMYLAGVIFTLPDNLVIIILAAALTTAGFFGAHSVLSGAVNRLARTAKSQASALYLLVFYIGGSVLGTGVGFIWDAAAWPGVAWSLAAMAVIAILLVARTPQPTQEAA